MRDLPTDVTIDAASRWVPLCRECGWRGTPTTDNRQAANERHACQVPSR